MESRFPVPDAVFILDLNPAESVHRIAHARGEPDHFEGRDYLERVRRVFNSMAGEAIYHLDGSRPAAEVHARVLDLFIEGPLKKKRGSEYSGLAGKLRANASRTGSDTLVL